MQESPLEETGSGGFSLVEEWQLPIGGAVARAEKNLPLWLGSKMGSFGWFCNCKAGGRRTAPSASPPEF